MGEGDKIAHLALQGHIGYQPVAGFRVHARQVAGVGVAVGVAIFHIKEEHEVIAVGQAHLVSPSGVLVVSDLVKKVWRWW